MKSALPHVVLCNGAMLPVELQDGPGSHRLVLDYQERGGVQPNVRLALLPFARTVGHLPGRVLDLLEIAAYVFCADRLTLRGSTDAVEYHSWPRTFHFVVKVRDHEFWSTPEVQRYLGDALCFMAGDNQCAFTFEPGHSTPLAGLFDGEEFWLEPGKGTSVILFSGGLDSLAGALARLECTDGQVCLVSHRSQSGTIRTQNDVYLALKELYPGRLDRYPFDCTLRGVHAAEETQRTRAFLYSAIAYALCNAFSLEGFFLYENGITALNFAKRQDNRSGRTSRTAHPKTIALLRRFYTAFGEAPVRIQNPLLWSTKADVFAEVATSRGKHLIRSTVSCSRRYLDLGDATHCGVCSQCVDRHFAAYAAKAEDLDGQIYAADFIRNDPGVEGKMRVVEYVRQARQFASWGIDHFASKMVHDLVDVDGYVDGLNEEELIERVYRVCSRHGGQVGDAIRRMRDLHDHPFHAVPKNSLFDVVGTRQYLHNSVEMPDVPREGSLPAAAPMRVGHQDVAVLPGVDRGGDSMIKVLFLAANPVDADRIRLDEEVREIQDRLRRGEHGDRFELRQQWAVRVTDLQETMLRESPAIVHFSGHASRDTGLVFEDRNGNACAVSVGALEQLFGALGEGVKCVVLNACFTEQQAKAIARHIPCVIGMSDAIADAAAVSFAWAFYQALAFGKSVDVAFRLGLNEIQLEGLDGSNTPTLLVRKGVDPGSLVIT